MMRHSRDTLPHAALLSGEGSARTKLAALILILAVLTFTAFAAAADSKTVSSRSGDETVQGLLHTPSGDGPFPAIIVIHEYWGLNDWVKEQATKLSDQGYVALPIDLYRGQGGEDAG